MTNPDIHSFGGDALEARSETLEQRDLYYSEFANIKRAAEQAALPKGSPASTGTTSGTPGATPAAGGATKGTKGTKTDKADAGKAGVLPTKVVTLSPKPTACKKGETPSAKHAGHRLVHHQSDKHASADGNKGTHDATSGSSSKKSGDHKKGAAEGSSSSASAASTPALVPRATTGPTKGATPTGSASGANATPTAHPTEGVKGKGGKGDGKVRTITRKGRDGHSTVYHVHRGTKTPCHAAQETGVSKGGKGGAGAKVDAKATPAGGSEKPQKTPTSDPKTPSKSTADAKLVARYEELLE